MNALQKAQAILEKIDEKRREYQAESPHNNGYAYKSGMLMSLFESVFVWLPEDVQDAFVKSQGIETDDSKSNNYQLQIYNYVNSLNDEDKSLYNILQKLHKLENVLESFIKKNSSKSNTNNKTKFDNL